MHLYVIILPKQTLFIIIFWSLTENESKACLAMTYVYDLQSNAGVPEAKVLVQELRRITVLWDELWFGSLTQHQPELLRKMCQLKSEVSRLEANNSLTLEEKCNLIKTKYEIIFKPIVLLLEQLDAISSRPPETPHELRFQQQYSDLIKEALSGIKQPQSFFQPQENIAKLRQLLSTLQQNKISRRSSATLSVADISPRLSEMKDTTLALPGILGKSGEVSHKMTCHNCYCKVGNRGLRWFILLLFWLRKIPEFYFLAQKSSGILFFGPRKLPEFYFLAQENFQNFIFWPKKTTGILFFGPRKRGPKNKIPEVFLTKKAKIVTVCWIDRDCR